MSAALELAGSSLHYVLGKKDVSNVILREFAFATNKGGSSVIRATFVRKKYFLLLIGYRQQF